MAAHKSSNDFIDFEEFGREDSAVVEVDTSDHQTHTFRDFPDSAVDEDDVEGHLEQNKLLEEDKPAAGGAIWSVEYYRKYFNVDTKDVRSRCMWSMVPKPGSNFLRDHLQHNPDLYGPFWICVTLVISVAVMGNLASYLQIASQGGEYTWKYDFHKLTLAATVVFSYAWLVPIVLWAAFWWRGGKANISLLQLVCLYGYSLTVYIPISVLCASGVWQLQWALMLLGFLVSGAVLLVSLWSAMQEEEKKVALAVATVVLLLHLALAAGFLLYFFRVPVVAGHQVPSAAVSPAVPAAVSNPAAPAAPDGAPQPAADGQKPPPPPPAAAQDKGNASKPAQPKPEQQQTKTKRQTAGETAPKPSSVVKPSAIDSRVRRHS